MFLLCYLDWLGRCRVVKDFGADHLSFFFKISFGRWLDLSRGGVVVIGIPFHILCYSTTAY